MSTTVRIRPKLMRVTTALISLDKLLEGQMRATGEAGFDVVMVSADGPRRDEIVVREGCRHLVVPMSRRLSPLADLVGLIRLTRLVGRERPDIVHTQTPKAGLLGMLAAKACHVPVRLHTFGGLRLETMRGWRRRLMLVSERLTTRCTTRVLCNSHALAERLRELEVCDPLVLGAGSTNGVDPRYFEPAFDSDHGKEVFRSSMGIAASDTVLLFLGRIVRDKGVEELVEAFVELAGDRPDLRLLLVGAPEPDLDPLRPDTLRAIAEHPRIVTLPWSERVHELLSSASALVHPSHREGLPNVVLQAAASGCPIICSDIAANLEVLESTERAFVFRVGDSRALRRAVGDFLEDRSGATERARVLRAATRTRFDRAQVQQRLIDFYRRELAPSQEVTAA